MISVNLAVPEAGYIVAVESDRVGFWLRKKGYRIIATRRQTMDLREAIYTRRATREFTAEPVDERTIRKLIDAAVQAPSAVNQQPWSFCVVRDKAVLARISQDAKAYMLRSSPVGLFHITSSKY